MGAWDAIVLMHAAADWPSLVLLYGSVSALFLFLVLQVLRTRSDRAARRVAEHVDELDQDLHRLHGVVQEMEQRLAERIDGGLSALETRITEALSGEVQTAQRNLERAQERFTQLVTAKSEETAEHIDAVEAAARETTQQVDDVRRRVAPIEEGLGRLTKAEQAFADQLRATRIGVEERMSDAETRLQQVLGQLAGVTQRIGQVEDSIPNLYEQLEDFRNALSNIFRTKLGAVLNSFDSSVGAVLEHMKSELEMGISRIRSIEDMVQSRHQAEWALLGPGEVRESEVTALPDAEVGTEEDAIEIDVRDHAKPGDEFDETAEVQAEAGVETQVEESEQVEADAPAEPVCEVEAAEEACATAETQDADAVLTEDEDGSPRSEAA